jgi:hypothetical protein
VRGSARRSVERCGPLRRMICSKKTAGRGPDMRIGESRCQGCARGNDSTVCHVSRPAAWSMLISTRSTLGRYSGALLGRSFRVIGSLSA